MLIKIFKNNKKRKVIVEKYLKFKEKSENY